MHTALVRTRSVGAAIVEEAERSKAEVAHLDFAGASPAGLSAVKPRA